MKVVVVAALSRGRYRTTLGTALTGCYSTMWKSQEGRDAIEAATKGGQQGLMELLYRLTGKATRARDAEHPKLRRIVDVLLERWDRGEKSLVFCFRVPTAEALHATLSHHIENRLHKKQLALFKARGTEVKTKEDRDKGMQQFRRSLTAREASGVSLFVDRVLIGWFLQLGWQLPVLTQFDVRAVASLAARAEIKGRSLFPDAERPDRVFLARAIEHTWARRLAGQTPSLPKTADDGRLTTELLEQMAQESWVRDRYGRRNLSTGGESEGAEATERAARSSLAASITPFECPCAVCTGAHGTEPQKTSFSQPQPSNPFQMYKPGPKMEHVEPIGNYAIQIHWNDGHSSGIYSYDHLRAICPCAKCEASRA